MRCPPLPVLVACAALASTAVPWQSQGQGRTRAILVAGAVRTAPSGTRFALGTRLGTFSVETRGARLVRAGRAATFREIVFGSSVAVFGTLVPATATTRATIVAARIEIAPPAPNAVPGTARRRTASKER